MAITGSRLEIELQDGVGDRQFSLTEADVPSSHKASDSQGVSRGIPTANTDPSKTTS